MSLGLPKTHQLVATTVARSQRSSAQLPRLTTQEPPSHNAATS